MHFQFTPLLPSDGARARRRVGRDATKREGSQECGSPGRSPQNATTVVATIGAATVRFGASICRCSAGCSGRWSRSNGAYASYGKVSELVPLFSCTKNSVRLVG
jgi:hypothetical protein